MERTLMYEDVIHDCEVSIVRRKGVALGLELISLYVISLE